MKEISKISIVVSFLALWITSKLESGDQTMIGFFFIFSFGILHGANDLVLIKNLKDKKNRSYLTFLSMYVSIVLISALLFTTIPLTALMIFIVISAYHFGEQHFQDLEEYRWRFGKPLFYFVYGSFILLVLFYFHSVEVQKVILNITGYDLNVVTNPIPMIVSGIALSLLMAYNYFNLPNFKKRIASEILYLFIFALIFKLGSLIWGFAIYLFSGTAYRRCMIRLNFFMENIPLIISNFILNRPLSIGSYH